MIGRYQLWGFTAFLAVIAVMYGSRLRSLAQSVLRKLQSSSRAAVIRGLRRPVLGLLSVALLLFLVRMELKIVGEFVVSPVHNHDVRAEVPGIIAAVIVKEGDRVDIGAPLVRLDDRDLRAEREQVAAEIDAQRARRRLLVAGARAEEIDVAESDVRKASERLKYARGDLEGCRAGGARGDRQ